MEKRFPYKLSRPARIMTGVWSVVIILIAAAIWGFSDGAYMRAWLFTIYFAVLALYVLSIPRYLKITPGSIEIHCVIEMTRILTEDIASARRIGRGETSNLIVLLGSYGFFGYFGYYFDFREWENIKVYASQWSGLVEITDIYEQKFIVSCPEPDKFIAMIEANIAARAEQTATEKTSISDE